MITNLHILYRIRILYTTLLYYFYYFYYFLYFCKGDIVASILSKIFFFFVCQSLAETSDVLFEYSAPGAPILFGVIVFDGFSEHLFCQFDGMLNAVLFARLGIFCAGAEVKNFVKNILDNYISATSITCCISRT